MGAYRQGVAESSYVNSAGHMRGLPAEIEQMVVCIDTRVTQSSQAEGARARMLEDQARRLHEGLQAMRVAREIHDERRAKELQMLEQNIMLEIGKARDGKKKVEATCEDYSCERLRAHQEEILRSRQQHGQVQQTFAREIGDEVKRLSAILEEQKASRVEYGERIVASLEGEYQKVHENIVSEQKFRFEAEGTMLRMVEDVCTRMRLEVQQERTEREEVQAKLLGLLEDTCNRIEGTFTVEPGVGFVLGNRVMSGRA